MASNYTENYGLCQWEATDQVLRTDFNEDNEKIDGVLKQLHNTSVALEAKDAALETLIGHRGNCSIETLTYTGTGTYGASNPTIINFSKQPTVFIVWPTNDGGGDAIMVGRGGESSIRCFGFDMNGPYCEFWSVTASWSGGRLSFYTNDAYQGYNQLNYPDTTYLVIAFYAQS